MEENSSEEIKQILCQPYLPSSRHERGEQEDKEIESLKYQIKTLQDTIIAMNEVIKKNALDAEEFQNKILMYHKKLISHVEILQDSESERKKKEDELQKKSPEIKYDFSYEINGYATDEEKFLHDLHWYAIKKQCMDFSKDPEIFHKQCENYISSLREQFITDRNKSDKLFTYETWLKKKVKFGEIKYKIISSSI